MDIRGRLKHRAVLKRAQAAEKVSPEAVGAFWQQLSREARLEVLRFDDAALVQQIQSHMKALCHSELWHAQFAGSGAARPGRLAGFAFECPAERDCMGYRMSPTVFCATPEFVEIDDILEHLKEQLGSDFLAGRPALHRSDWNTVVEATPSSWHQLQMQVLRLVELALFYAQQDTGGSGTPRASDARPVASEDAQKAQAAKARPRKKKNKAAVAALHHEEGAPQIQQAECDVSCDASLTKEAVAEYREERPASLRELSPVRAPSPSPEPAPNEPASSSWSAWITSLVWQEPEVNVDIDAVNDFWCSLDLDERLAVLRFEDGALVQQLHGHLKALCERELWNKQWVADAQEEERLSGFGFERPAKPDWLGRSRGPDAFCATPEFAGNDRLLDHLEQRLGSPFMVGRPVLPRGKWSTIAETAPESWRELQQQVCRLVELAVLHAQQDAAQNGRRAAPWQSGLGAADEGRPAAHEDATGSSLRIEQDEVTDQASFSGTSGLSPTSNAAAATVQGESQRKRPKARKKKNLASKAAAVEDQEGQKGEEETAVAEHQEAAAVEDQECQDGQEEIAATEHKECALTTHDAAEHEDSTVGPDEASRCGASAFGCSAQDADADAADGAACGCDAAEHKDITVGLDEASPQDAGAAVADGEACAHDAAGHEDIKFQRTDAPSNVSSVPQVRWSTWVPSVLMNEWHWVQLQPNWSGPQWTHAGTRVVVKNTFLDTEVGAEQPPRRKRISGSCYF